MPAKAFLRDYWQKKPLVVRGAFPGFGGDLDRDGLLARAARDDVESRWISRAGGRWGLRRGPIAARTVLRSAKPWTVLVQGADLVLPAANALASHFDFIPRARFDDVMVSFATDGGGVGPHIDNYDVFLVQGSGRRRWRIGPARDRTLVDGVPLKILRRFEPDEEHVLAPGDMLYLPPDWAHDGIADGDCMTWSVGFRTAPADELATQFLGFLQDHLGELCELDGRYADPDLKLPAHPGEIDGAMIARTRKLLSGLRWDQTTLRDFLGVALTEPKPHVFFTPPAPALGPAAFARKVSRNGLALDPRSRLLFAQDRVFLNGELEAVAADDLPAVIRLADARVLGPMTLDGSLRALLHEWYRCGFIHPGSIAE